MEKFRLSKLLLQTNRLKEVFDLVVCDDDLKAMSVLDESLVSIAATLGPDALEVVLRAGASPNLRDTSGSFPLIDACSLGNLHTVKILLDYNADLSMRNSLGDTPFSAACAHGHYDVAKLLYQRGAKINECVGQGMRPVDWAKRSGCRDLIEWLEAIMPTTTEG